MGRGHGGEAVTDDEREAIYFGKRFVGLATEEEMRAATRFINERREREHDAAGAFKAEPAPEPEHIPCPVPYGACTPDGCATCGGKGYTLAAIREPTITKAQAREIWVRAAGYTTPEDPGMPSFEATWAAVTGARP